MTLRLLIAIADPELASGAAALASEGEDLEIVGSIDDDDEVDRALRRLEPDVVVLHDTLGAKPALTLAREISAKFPEVGLVLIASGDSPDLLRSAMQAGLRDVVSLPLSFEQLDAGIRAAAQLSSSVRHRVAGEESPAQGIGGEVIAVAGAKGGVGTTTVAVQLALAVVRATPDSPVCLVDFDLQSGDLGAMLDTVPRRSIADLVEVADEITGRHLRETLYSHPAGLRLLLSPKEGWRSELITPEVARNVVEAARSGHRLTIVDVGSRLSEATLAAVEAASRLVIVTTPDRLAMRGVLRMRELLADVQALESDDAIVLLNRTSRKLQIQADAARRQFVDMHVARTTVPSDFIALEKMVNTGSPERLTDQKILAAFDALALELDTMPLEEEEDFGAIPEPRGLLARLTGERGQSTVEALGVLPLILVIMLGIWQLGLVGYTYVLAGHAAREGARELATDPSEPRDKVPPYRKVASEDLPKAWRTEAEIERRGTVTVAVKLRVPLVLPGFDGPLRISSSAATSVEDAPLPDSQTKDPS